MHSLDNKTFYASIDFGTNTFHVLIALVKKDSVLKYIDNKRWFVFLDRSREDTITKEAYACALKAAQEISEYLKSFDLKNIYAVGTEVFRNKCNGNLLLNDLSHLIGSNIELIDGKKEAELAFTGVNELIAPVFTNYHLIDIGGGSTEFIIVQENQKLWDKSYRIGLSVLKQHISFYKELSSDQNDMLNIFLDKVLKDKHLFEATEINALVLNGGSAELFQKVLRFNQLNDYTQVFTAESVLALCHEWLFSSYERRLKSDWIPDQRKELMPLYLAKVSYLIKRFEVREVVYSAASIKEGLILYKK